MSELNNPCLMCGQHEAITEYFENELYAYCPVSDQNVSITEFEAEIARLEELAEQERTAYAECTGHDTTVR
jgi:hypothetical protein